MKNALGILLVIALIIIFLQNICKPPVKDSNAIEKYKALEQRIKDTAEHYEQIMKADNAAINKAEQAAADQYEKSEVYRKALNEQKETVNKLALKVKAAKYEPPDLSWVKVSKNYLDGCDSLANENIILGQAIDKYQTENAEAHKLLLYETGVRDSALDNCHEFNLKFKSQIDSCKAQLKDKVGKKQPVQIYFGIGMLGNKINPIGGGQVNVSLRARNSQIYEVTGMMVGKEWYGGIGTKLLITFKK